MQVPYLKWNTTMPSQAVAAFGLYFKIFKTLAADVESTRAMAVLSHPCHELGELKRVPFKYKDTVVLK